eukprot:Colp12_sorted_trinity150504_noHs@35514
MATAENNGRSLHWVHKIGNLAKSHHFYADILGMHVLRHEEFNSGCEATCNGPYARPWSKTMIGYGPELNHFVLELTYNYGIKSYKKGDDYRYIVINKPDALERAAAANYPVHETSLGKALDSPDGYRYIITDKKTRTGSDDPVQYVSINVSNLANAEEYWHKVLGLKVYSRGDVEGHASILLGFADDQAKLELVETGAAIDHAVAFGRIAFAIPDIHPVHKAAVASGDKIQNEPINLTTPGKADVQVVILVDRDGYEICFVGEVGFNDLSTTKPGDEVIDWETRKGNGADR